MATKQAFPMWLLIALIAINAACLGWLFAQRAAVKAKRVEAAQLLGAVHALRAKAEGLVEKIAADPCLIPPTSGGDRAGQMSSL